MSSPVKKLVGAVVIALALVAVNALMSEEGLFGFGVPPYTGRILMLAGINVVLAVSLNLINGFTGQFSIGHAGFMAIGAYSSASRRSSRRCWAASATFRARCSAAS